MVQNKLPQFPKLPVYSWLPLYSGLKTTFSDRFSYWMNDARNYASLAFLPIYRPCLRLHPRYFRTLPLMYWHNLWHQPQPRSKILSTLGQSSTRSPYFLCFSKCQYSRFCSQWHVNCIITIACYIFEQITIPGRWRVCRIWPGNFSCLWIWIMLSKSVYALRYCEKTVHSQNCPHHFPPSTSDLNTRLWHYHWHADLTNHVTKLLFRFSSS